MPREGITPLDTQAFRQLGLAFIFDSVRAKQYENIGGPQIFR
jgi:hypothetical protein